MHGDENTTIDCLAVGDRIRIQDADGVVTRINGPHGPLGTPPTTDWYTLRVLFDAKEGLVGHGVHSTSVGPQRGTQEVLRYGA